MYIKRREGDLHKRRLRERWFIYYIRNVYWYIQYDCKNERYDNYINKRIFYEYLYTHFFYPWILKTIYSYIRSK